MKKLLLVFLSSIVLLAACKQAAPNGPEAGTPPKITEDLSDTQKVSAQLNQLVILEVTATGTGLAYEWYEVQKDNTIAVVQTKSTSHKFTVTKNENATFVYFCRVYSIQSGKTTVYTDSKRQTVIFGTGGSNSEGSGSTAPVPQLKDLPSLKSWPGRSFSLTVHPTSGTAPDSWTYQWYEVKKEDPNKTTETKIDGATGQTYTTAQTKAKTYYYYCIVTNAPSGKTPAPKKSTVAAVTVTDNPPAQAQVPNVTIVQGSCSINSGENATLSVNVQVTDTGVLSYQWYTTEETTASSGTLISGETQSSITVSPTQTTKYYCQVTNTLEIGGGKPTLTAAGVSGLITVMVNSAAQPVQPATITDPTAEQTKTTSKGVPITLSVTATAPDGGQLSYQWYSNTTKSTVNGQPIPGAESTEYSFSAQTAGTYYLYCAVTNTKAGASADPVNSPVFTVTVTENKQPAAKPVIKQQPPATLKLQKGQSKTIEIKAESSDGGTLSYQWYVRDNNTSDGTEHSNTAATLTIPTGTIGTKYYRCKVTNRNDNALAGQQTASEFTNWCKVEVTEEDTLDKFMVTASSAASARIATGKTAALTVEINDKPDGAQQGIQWYKGTPPANDAQPPAGDTITPNGNAETYTTPTNLTAGTYTFYCQVTFSKQVDSETKIAKKYSPAFTVTVVEPAAPAISVQPKGGQAVKTTGVSLTITAAVDQTASIGTPQYQWYKNTVKETTGGTMIDTATTLSYTAKDEGTFYYYCVVSNSEDTSKTITSDVVSVMVYRDAAAKPVDMNGETDGLDWATQNWTLGNKKEADGTTFAVYSKNAERVMLEIYDTPDAAQPKGAFFMEKNSTDNIWRAKINTSGITTVYYGYRAWGPNWKYKPEWKPGTGTGFESDVDAQGNRFNPNKLLTDPYSLELSHTRGSDGSFYQTADADRNKDSGQAAPKSVVVEPLTPLNTVKSTSSALTTEVIYQLHVKGFTGGGVNGINSVVTNFEDADKGTYSGAAKMIPYLQGLGVNTVLLMPVFESEGLEDYASANFFAVKKAYARDKNNAAQEFQNMVKAFHAKNIQVFLDVPYANSGENGILDSNKNKVRLESLRGLDNTAYYALSSSDKTDYWVSTDYMNNLNGSSTQVQDLILASLKYWTETMGIDGFRFSSGATLGREGDAWAFNKNAVLLTKIKTYLADKNRKYIIETKDKNSTQNEVFDAGWIAWNNTFRDSVRKTVNWVQKLNESQLNTTIGTAGTLNFAASDTRLRIRDSLNRDGSNDGEYAGNFQNNEQDLRQRYRNLLILTLLSKGAPMLTYGDEFGRGQNGHWSLYDGSNVETNNYSSLQTASTSDKLLYEFTKKLIKLRKDNAAFFKDATYTFKKFDNSGDSGDDQAFCILISDANNSVQYAVCVNNTHGELNAQVKAIGGNSQQWKPLIDTGNWAEAKDDSAKMEGNFYTDDAELKDDYGVGSNRVVVLKKS